MKHNFGVIEKFEEDIIESQVKLFILSSPHNPIGRVWTKEELIKMGDICLKHNVLIISDEIHSDLIFKEHKHCSFLTLDKKYLILEMLNKPNFYEGELFYQILYDINKSMIENVKEYNLSITDFKEYVEMWIHEVKIPIASLTLISHNHQNEIDKKYIEQIRKLDNYIDQILYFVRSENVEKDYIIKEKKLQEIIKNVALKNKDDLLENAVRLDVDVHNEKVLTDSKWLEFILNQIINNSIKYKRKNTESYIKIKANEDKDRLYLTICDNGIGIPKSDIKRVFDKSFTGENGRTMTKSTGMGLYIAKKLCDKLGHKITVESEINEYTKITIIFTKNNFYKPDN